MHDFGMKHTVHSVQSSKIYQEFFPHPSLQANSPWQVEVLLEDMGAVIPLRRELGLMKQAKNKKSEEQNSP